MMKVEKNDLIKEKFNLPYDYKETILEEVLKKQDLSYFFRLFWKLLNDNQKLSIEYKDIPRKIYVSRDFYKYMINFDVLFIKGSELRYVNKKIQHRLHLYRFCLMIEKGPKLDNNLSNYSVKKI